MFPRFEVWIGEAKENLGELGFAEEVGEEFHGVCSEARGVLICAWFLGSQGFNSLLDVFCYLSSNLHAWRGELVKRADLEERYPG